MLNVPVDNFSVMLGWSHRFLGITSTFFFFGGGGGGKLLKDTTRRLKWGSNPRPLDPESEVLTTRPPRPPLENVCHATCELFKYMYVQINNSKVLGYPSATHIQLNITVRPVLNDHLKQDIFLAFQTGVCLLLNESRTESSEAFCAIFRQGLISVDIS